MVDGALFCAAEPSRDPHPSPDASRLPLASPRGREERDCFCGCYLINCDLVNSLLRWRRLNGPINQNWKEFIFLFTK